MSNSVFLSIRYALLRSSVWCSNVLIRNHNKEVEFSLGNEVRIDLYSVFGVFFFSNLFKVYLYRVRLCNLFLCFCICRLSHIIYLFCKDNVIAYSMQG